MTSKAEAVAAHCWFPRIDRAPGDPATTAWKRRARLRQAKWREARGYPIGREPYDGAPTDTPVGSRIALEYARSGVANLMTPNALRAARARVAAPERHQMLSENRLWADLLSSMPFCFNLFGDLAEDSHSAATAIRAWWPDAPCGEVNVRFEHSPGRCDPSFLGNKTAFDVALEIRTDNGANAIIGVETKYHEHAVKPESPNPEVIKRYTEVTNSSGLFVDGWQQKVIGTELQQIWLDHLLVLSMLQHPSRRWSWGRFVLIYPRENLSFARLAERYSALLRDTKSFAFTTIEDLLNKPNVIPDETARLVWERYLAGACPVRRREMVR